jgi:enoyl-CoA hydratase
MRPSEIDDLQYEIVNTVAYITFNRPEKHNALTPEMMQAGARAIRHADRNQEVRVIVVTGAGDAFCTGADLERTIPAMTGDEPDIEPGQDDLFLRHRLIRTPIIAAINGLCVAGGMEFLQATDIRIAEESAQFGLQEPRWGLAPVAGSHVRLPRQLPYCRAMEYLLTGNLFSASHALNAGLINEIVPDNEAHERATEIANSIAANSPFAVRKIKEIVHRCTGRPLGDAFRLETQIAREIFASEDAVEGPQAFTEGRDPSFRR